MTKLQLFRTVFGLWKHTQFRLIKNLWISSFPILTIVTRNFKWKCIEPRKIQYNNWPLYKSIPLLIFSSSSKMVKRFLTKLLLYLLNTLFNTKFLSKKQKFNLIIFSFALKMIHSMMLSKKKNLNSLKSIIKKFKFFVKTRFLLNLKFLGKVYKSILKSWSK